MPLLLIIFFSVRTYFRAKKGGLPPSKWVIYTILSVMVAWFLGAIITSIIFVIKDPTIQEMMTSGESSQEAVMKYLATQDMLIPEIFMLFCGVGGYLFIRHQLLRVLERNAQR